MQPDLVEAAPPAGLVWLTPALPVLAGNGWIESWTPEGVRVLSLAMPERPPESQPCGQAPERTRSESPEQGRAAS